MKSMLGDLALLACGATGASDGANVLSPAQLEERGAQFIVFVPPEHPRHLAAAGVTSEVDVFGQVAADGSLTVTRAVSTQPDPAFVPPEGRSSYGGPRRDGAN